MCENAVNIREKAITHENNSISMLSFANKVVTLVAKTIGKKCM